VVVGASLAGATAAATLREEGEDGRIVLIGDDHAAPYERPELSKAYLRGEATADDLLVRPPEAWSGLGIELRPGERVETIDPASREVLTGAGERIGFDVAVVATGVRNRPLEVPGAGLEGVFRLRTVEDADAIRRAASSASKAVVVGFGFIGAEVTASLRRLGLDVEVVEPLSTALERVLGRTIGSVLESIHRDEAVAFRFGDTVDRLEGDGRVERVVTAAGHVADADLVVVGVGTTPNAEVADAVGLAPDGGVAVGPTLETGVPGVFAVGDVATHEHPIFGSIRVEHYDNAIRTGAHAARNLLGAGAVFDDPHWFWSEQYDHRLEMAGFVRRPDEADVVVRGSVEDRRFSAFLLDGDGVLRGSVSLDRPRDVRRSMRLIRAGVAPPRGALADPDVDLRGLAPGPG
jgi:3-phenylpropionate/trans-cinnamate dioxygenase ferredoxin reductase subunit